MSLEVEKILRRFENGSFAIECAFCGGNGLLPETAYSDPSLHETQPCHVCNGKGLNVFQNKPEDYVQCRYCAGEGKQWDDSGYFLGGACQVCQGMGIVLLEPPKENRVDEDILWKILHPSSRNVARSRFESGHYADSVEAALKEVNVAVKKVVKSVTGEELDGAPLMHKAFSPKQPIIHVGDLSTESGRSTQQGYMQIFAGAMTGIRNPKAHDNLVISRYRAIHFLFLASLLMFRLDECI